MDSLNTSPLDVAPRAQVDLGYTLPVLLIPSLLFFEDLPNLFKGLYGFGMQTAFNAPVHACLRWLLGDVEIASWATYGLFAVWCGYVFIAIEPLKAFYCLLLGFVLLGSIVHYGILCGFFLLRFLCLHWFGFGLHSLHACIFLRYKC